MDEPADPLTYYAFLLALGTSVAEGSIFPLASLLLEAGSEKRKLVINNEVPG
jgi:hypothetical protein